MSVNSSSVSQLTLTIYYSVHISYYFSTSKTLYIPLYLSCKISTFSKLSPPTTSKYALSLLSFH